MRPIIQAMGYSLSLISFQRNELVWRAFGLVTKAAFMR